MKDGKELNIKYRSGVMHKGDIDGVPYEEYEYDYISASISSVKRFKSALMLLMGVSGCGLHLIEYLSDIMTDGNYVHNNELTRLSFIKFHSKFKKTGNKDYSDHAVKKAFQQLALDGLLIPVVRGTYMVNPTYYFGKSDEDRVRSIKMMMEFKSDVDTKINVEISK